MIKIQNIINNNFIELNDTGPFLLTSVNFNNIEASHSTFKAVGQNGSYLQNTVLSEREILIDGYILADSKEEMNIKKNLISSIVNPTDDINLYTKNRKITGRPTSTIQFGTEYKDNNDQACKFAFTLFCSNPYFNNLSDSRIDIALWQKTFHFPIESRRIIFGVRNPSLIANIINDGDTDIGMVIEFRATGTVKNPQLFDIKTQKFMKIDTIMKADEIIRVDTRKDSRKIVSICNGTETNIFNKENKDATMLQLKRGDNVLRYNADDNLDHLDVSLYYNPNYIYQGEVE